LISINVNVNFHSHGLFLIIKIYHMSSENLEYSEQLICTTDVFSSILKCVLIYSTCMEKIIYIY